MGRVYEVWEAMTDKEDTVSAQEMLGWAFTGAVWASLLAGGLIGFGAGWVARMIFVFFTTYEAPQP